ncbi:DMT family transporter [Rhizobium sp. KVB221]|uniref:DMT family transporter n=1 Tax=Rhizobium setariae TaxID=2801340 RepID=A0A936YKR0_9HYPH|nr:DMT family transporter [Rhizobium setariae]MBL0372130.1 DMT family transporter [Rhizobium setariae]
MNKTVLSGVILTSFSYFLFSLQDAAVKLLVVGLPVFQILFIRSVVIFCICLAIGRKPVVVAAVTSPVLLPLFFRNLLLLGAWLAFYSAARDLGLAELTTVYYASPVIITLLAVPILKERVPAIRWVAVIFGFIGVVIACNPIGNGMTLSLPVGLALLAAVLWAVSTVLLRKTAMHEKTIVQMMVSSGFFIVVTGIACLFLWTPVSATELGLMAGTGLLAGIAQFAFFESMRRAPVSILAPFEYTSLIWAFMLGFAIWGDVPQDNVFFGAGLIFAAGAIIVLGERFMKRLDPPASVH